MRALVWACGACLLLACESGKTRGVDAEPPNPEVGVGPVLPNGISPLADAPPPIPKVGSGSVVFEPAGQQGLHTTAAVDVRLKVSGVDGRGKVAAEFVAPGGFSFERRTVDVVGAPTDTRELSFHLPVAGTLIPANNLSGVWEVRFFLDGAPLTTTSFQLDL